MKMTGKNETILIAMKDEHLRRGIQDILELENYQIVAITDTMQTAVERSIELLPDLILIDTALDDIDIEQAIETITNVFPTVMMILIGEKLSSSLENVKSSHTLKFLAKPFDVEDLVITVGNLLNRHMSTLRTELQDGKHKILTILPHELRLRPIVHFNLFSSPKIVAETRSHLYMYAHSAEHLDTIQKDVEKFAEELGGEIPDARKAKQSPRLAVGTTITVVPECDEVDFEPATLTKKWHGDWTRYEFEFRPSEELIDEMLFIRVSIRVKGLEIAHIKTSTVVVESKQNNSIIADAMMAEPTTLSDNPLVNAMQRGELSVVTAKPYNKMFISYSRRDQEIALKRAKEVEQILGTDVFLDVKSLRAGDDWQYQLAKAIDDADVFHLLWSEHSANSEYCRYEWEYALQKKCPENMCVGVIRLVYWQKPVPDPPEELAHLHFEYIEIEDKKPPSVKNIFGKR